MADPRGAAVEWQWRPSRSKLEGAEEAEGDPQLPWPSSSHSGPSLLRRRHRRRWNCSPVHSATDIQRRGSLLFLQGVGIKIIPLKSMNL